MNKIKNILLILLGMMLMYGLCGAYNLNASLVTYDNKNTTLESDNVEGAIDELGLLVNTKLQYGTASENDILDGKTALVNGKEVIGTLVNSGFFETLSKSGEYESRISYSNTDIIPSDGKVIIIMSTQLLSAKKSVSLNGNSLPHTYYIGGGLMLGWFIDVSKGDTLTTSVTGNTAGYGIGVYVGFIK